MEAVQPDKRRLIIDSAVRTFARKGYHLSRVSDIAKEAGVAYGLVYHYFQNKEEILNSIFQENWSLFIQVLKSIEKNNDDLTGKFDSMCSFLLESYRNKPELMEVIIIEVTRSHKFMEEQNLELFKEALVILQRMIKKEKRSSKKGINYDVNIASYMVLGSIETVLSGFVLRVINLDDAKSFNKAKKTMVNLVMGGLRGEG